MDVVNPEGRMPYTSMDNDSSNCHCVCYDGTQDAYQSAKNDGGGCNCNCAPASINPYNRDYNFEVAFDAAKT